MLSAWSRPGNAGSSHFAGEQAATIVSEGRSAVANLIGAAPSEIVFTSGATEANNLAITGIAQWAVATNSPRRRIVVSAIEHKAVLEPARMLAAKGFEIVVSPVNANGIIDTFALAKLVGETTLLVSVMAANNETGVIQPIADIAAIAHASGALFHCDAAQAAGKFALNVVDIDIDYLSLSAHKFYGPMGIGALYISATAPKPAPIYFGGGQQGGLRPGTEPVPLIAGLGAAATAAASLIDVDAHHGRRLADRMRSRLAEHQVHFTSTTKNASILPGSLSLMMRGINANDLVMVIGKDLCVSTGSACTSGQITQSHVLSAMGLSQEDSQSTIRIYCGRYNSDEDVDRAASIISNAFAQIKHRAGRHHQ